MNWVDIVILVVVGLSANFGFFRGFVREAAGLITWILAFYLAYTMAGSLNGIFTQWVASNTLAWIAGFVSIFIVVLIVGAIANKILSGLIKGTGLVAVDRLLGSLFGALRGLAILVVIVMLATATNIPDKDWWQESSLMGSLESLSVSAREWVPTKLAEETFRSSDQENATGDQPVDVDDDVDTDGEDDDWDRELKGADILPFES